MSRCATLIRLRDALLERLPPRRSCAVPLALALSIAQLTPARATCPGKVALQVLGSGGPVADDARASSGYIVWVDGKSKVLVDAGGGVFLRFGEAKAQFEALDAIAITHLHADHVADLIAILKSGYFGDRSRKLPVLGPDGNAAFPGIKSFLDLMLDPKRGAYRYLSGYLDGSGGLAPLTISEIAVADGKPDRVLDADGVKITAVGVTHGPVPALGYLVEAGGRKIAFSGDQDGDNPAFAAMIERADILVMDHAVPEDAGSVETALHARPSDIGKLAKKAAVARLVLSHNMARSLKPLQQDLALIRKEFTGPTVVATDLMCVD